MIEVYNLYYECGEGKYMAAIILVALVAAWIFIGNYLSKIIRYSDF